MRKTIHVVPIGRAELRAQESPWAHWRVAEKLPASPMPKARVVAECGTKRDAVRVGRALAAENKRLTARLAEAQAAAKTWENEAERRSRRYEQAAVRLAEAVKIATEWAAPSIGNDSFDNGARHVSEQILRALAPDSAEPREIGVTQ